jgi:Resolvase, N terminal domain
MRRAIIASFTETENSKRKDRPELLKALEHCKRTRSVLVIAKLDRLARKVAFIANLMEPGVEFLAVDFPDLVEAAKEPRSLAGRDQRAEERGRETVEREVIALPGLKAAEELRPGGEAPGGPEPGPPQPVICEQGACYPFRGKIVSPGGFLLNFSFESTI